MKKILFLALYLVSDWGVASSIPDAIIAAAQREGVPPEVLLAICTVESGLDRNAYNHSDGGLKNSAFGVCQVLLTVANHYGFEDPSCRKNFIKKSSRSTDTCKLFDPYTNAIYAAKVLKYQLIRYDYHLIYAIAAYNTGSIKICKTGQVRSKHSRQVLYKCQIGALANRRYVDKVLRYLQEG